ncbi:MAG: T9SS type A sorting domain-containing protein [Fidelibacterota bacterium]
MKKFIIIVFTVFLTAQSPLWDVPAGAPIRQGIHVEWQRTVAPGDNDDVIVVWSDTRNGSRNIYAQKVLPDGSQLWGEFGSPVTNLPGRQEDPVAIEDGAGGAFIAWVDYRFDVAGDIFVQHISSSGQVLMNPSGVPLCQVAGTQITIAMCTDSLGGVFVTWQDNRNGVDQDIYGTHISFDNTVLAEGTGLPLATINGDQYRKSLEYSGNHQAQLTWTDERDAVNPEIYVQRFNPDMSLIFTENGINISNHEALDVGPRTTFMRGDTSLIAWQNGDFLTSKVLYQIISSTGPLFTAPGEVTNDPAIELSPRIKRDDLGNVFIEWKDLRFDPVNGDHFVQKVTPLGTLAWDSTGILLDTTDMVNLNVRFAPDNSGGAYFFWEQGTFPQVDIQSVHILSDGSKTYVPVTNQPGYQFAPIAGSSGAGDVFIIYADQETGSVYLKCQLISGDQLQFSTPGLTLRTGLDGDVKYVQHGLTSDGVQLSWEDSRDGKKIWGTAIAVDGTISEYNGHIMSYGDSQSVPAETEPELLVTDGNIYTSYFSTVTGVSQIRINKLSIDMLNLWDSTGVIVYDGITDQRRSRLIDTPNGLGVFWSDIRNNIDFDLYYQVLDAGGLPLLPDGGVLIADAQWVDDYVVDVFPTPDNHILVIAQEDSWGSGKYIAKKIDYNGTPAADWPSSGIILAGPMGDPDNLVGKIIGPSQGIFFVWTEINNFSSDVKAQVLHWDGTTAWFQGGTYLTTADNDQSHLAFDFSRDSSKALVVWEDFQNGLDFNISGQLVDLDNASLLGDNILFTSDTSFQINPTVQSISEDQFVIVWEDARGINNPDPAIAIGNDLYETWFSMSEQSFVLDGAPLIQEFHRQENAAFARLSDTELLLYWVDLRSSGKEDFSSLYGKLYLSSDFLTAIPNPIPATYPTAVAFPNPFNGKTVISFSVPEVAPVSIAIVNLMGQQIYDAVIEPQYPGNYQFTWSGNDILHRPVSSGVYLYKIQVNDIIYSGKLMYLK